MFKIKMDADLPMPGVVGRQNGHTGIVLNPYWMIALGAQERMNLINSLLAELERSQGTDLINSLLAELEQGQATVVDISEAREKRQISLLLAAVQDLPHQKGECERHGLDTHTR